MKQKQKVIVFKEIEQSSQEVREKNPREYLKIYSSQKIQCVFVKMQTSEFETWSPMSMFPGWWCVY